jgi:hypothetical protein
MSTMDNKISTVMLPQQVDSETSASVGPQSRNLPAHRKPLSRRASPG